MIKHLTPADSGRYACSRYKSENFASIFVHIIMQNSNEPGETSLIDLNFYVMMNFF